MSDDAASGLVLFFLAVWVAAFAAVVVVALSILAFIGYGVFIIARFLVRAIRRRLALRLIRWRRDRAIRRIRALSRAAAGRLAFHADREATVCRRGVRDAP